MTGHEDASEVVLGVTAFRANSHEVIEAVATGRLRRVVLTKRGRPLAALVPLPCEPPELWGALADVMEPVEGIDLTEPVGEEWPAEA